jgi:predicted enzyme related to lactoylglutathione lyase
MGLALDAVWLARAFPLCLDVRDKGSIAMPRPVHFEIHAADFERVKAFYTALFGWRFTKPPQPGIEFITTGSEGPGIDGSLIPRMGPNPDPREPTPVIGYICTHDVDDVDATVAKALSLGGMQALPKMAIPGIGWLAYVKDTESNIFGLMQRDEAAA